MKYIIKIKKIQNHERLSQTYDKKIWQYFSNKLNKMKKRELLPIMKISLI